MYCCEAANRFLPSHTKRRVFATRGERPHRPAQVAFVRRVSSCCLYLLLGFQASHRPGYRTHQEQFPNRRRTIHAAYSGAYKNREALEFELHCGIDINSSSPENPSHSCVKTPLAVDATRRNNAVRQCSKIQPAGIRGAEKKKAERLWGPPGVDQPTSRPCQ